MALQTLYVREHVHEPREHVRDVREHVRQFEECSSRRLFDNFHVRLENVRKPRVRERKKVFANFPNAKFTNNLGSGAISVDIYCGGSEKNSYN
jgi:hypothetical protein